MPRLSDQQDRFAAALRDPDAPIPENLLGRADEVPVAQFGVYRNNVHSSLVDALAATYPTVQRLVGTEFFRVMAQQYVHTTLPETPVLIDYGANFASFVTDFEPVRGLPYLADVTRIDWAWHQAYHAAEAEPLTAERLAAIPTDELGERCFGLHPSAQALVSPWPVLSIWLTNRHDATVKPIDLGVGGEEALICRPAHEVGVWRLSAGGTRFLQMLAAGVPLSEAALATTRDIPDFDLATTLQTLLNGGAVTGIR
jgi:hypothetical protein